MLPMFLKPPLGIQAAQACELQLPPWEQPAQFFEYEVATRRIRPARSKKSILRSTSSVVVYNSNIGYKQLVDICNCTTGNCSTNSKHAVICKDCAQNTNGAFLTD